MPESDPLLRTVLVVLAVVVLLPAVLMALLMPLGMLGWGGAWGMHDGVGAMAAFASVFLLLVLVAVGASLAYAWSSRRSDPTDPALEELRMAYARGDLSEEEFEQRRRRLEE